MASDAQTITSRGSVSRSEPHDLVERTTTCSTTVGKDGSAPAERIHSIQAQESVGAVVTTSAAGLATQMQKYANGYHFPPKYPLKEQIQMGLVAFWDFYNTGFGFFLTIYALNVVAWGGMLFLLLVNAAPEMCWVDGKFDCNNINSPRRIWIETDSQILNALFCVTGFGLAPWRFRDTYYLLMYQIRNDRLALRKLAGVHRGWFRLEGSDRLPAYLGPKSIEETTATYNPHSVPYPLETIPDAPPTGTRAPPTKLWKLSYVIYLNIWNTFFQIALSYCMWHLNRFNRPSWTTGLFVALACIVASMAGAMMGSEGKKVKSIEGVPLAKRDMARLARDRELGIPHYNNIKDKDPEEERDQSVAGNTAKRGKSWFKKSKKPDVESVQLEQSEALVG
ncbi:hypothetical protein F4780DRAFT_724550 [Xylariomycetidae sp. FL0641]|nr:hypothetical protein F4780DRAFT_724550 [Xylariomycetidae sp. FL0641]